MNSLDIYYLECPKYIERYLQRFTWRLNSLYLPNRGRIRWGKFWHTVILTSVEIEAYLFSDTNLWCSMSFSLKCQSSQIGSYRFTKYFSDSHLCNGNQTPKLQTFFKGSNNWMSKLMRRLDIGNALYLRKKETQSFTTSLSNFQIPFLWILISILFCFLSYKIFCFRKFN